MITGVSVMGHHNPRYLAADFAAMRQLELDDVFFCLQENDATESCDDPIRTWAAAIDVIRRAQAADA